MIISTQGMLRMANLAVGRDYNIYRLLYCVETTGSFRGVSEVFRNPLPAEYSIQCAMLKWYHCNTYTGSLYTYIHVNNLLKVMHEYMYVHECMVCELSNLGSLITSTGKSNC